MTGQLCAALVISVARLSPIMSLYSDDSEFGQMHPLCCPTDE